MLHYSSRVEQPTYTRENARVLYTPMAPSRAADDKLNCLEQSLASVSRMANHRVAVVKGTPIHL
jgi:hypothetical protein